MKKILAILLSLMLLVSLTACGGTKPHGTQPPGDDTTAAPDVTDAPDTTAAPEEVYSFTYEGVELIPGADFDPTVLPEATSVFQVPSCAIEGTDNVYSYGVLEVTAFDDGSGEVIYSIYILDANISTPEGLYLGDDVARVEELYGTDRTENGIEWIYQQGQTMLILLVEDDFVTSIEYRMVA